MAQLVFRFPARESSAAVVDDGARLSAAVRFCLSPDGESISDQGQAPIPLLPKADTVIALVPASALSWHHIVLPKAPAQRLRAALGGVLEEALLDDPESVHLALQPQARAGAQSWVCAVDRTWIKARIAEVEQHGLRIDRLVPEAVPGDMPQGTFIGADDTLQTDAPPTQNLQADGTQLLWSDARGVLSLPGRSALTRELCKNPAAWSAEPAAAHVAEEMLGGPVSVVERGQRMLAAAQSEWNLRQFDLVARSRGTRALRDFGGTLLGPNWRPLRWGLITLVLAQLLGLNAWAWQQEAQMRERQAQVRGLLQQTFPHVQVVVDAPLQMQRELDLLRARAGQPGAQDVETMLQALAAEWPVSQPIDALEFVPGQLTVIADGLSEEELAPVRDILESRQIQAVLQGNRLTLTAGAER